MQTTHPLQRGEKLRYDSPRILVVDDDITTLRVVKKHLQDAGYADVEVLSDSREAMSIIESFRPNMVLLDIFMPHANGLEILQKIRSNSDMDSVIVLMLSSAGKEEQFQSLEMGAIGFIQKPVLGEVLIDEVRKAIRVANRFGAF